MNTTDHHFHGGDACTFRDGACTECGVGDGTCPVCGGTGYHRADEWGYSACPDSDGAAPDAPLVAREHEDSGRLICFLAVLAMVAGLGVAIHAAAT